MARVKATIANIEIDTDDPAVLSGMLGTAVAAFTGRSHEVSLTDRVIEHDETRPPAPAIAVEEQPAPVVKSRKKKAKRVPRVERSPKATIGKPASARGSNAERVVEFLGTVESARAPEICENTGIPKGSLNAVLKNDARIAKVGYGLYALAGSSPKRPASPSSASDDSKPLADRIAALLKTRDMLDATSIAKELSVMKQTALDAMNDDPDRFEMDSVGLWYLL